MTIVAIVASVLAVAGWGAYFLRAHSSKHDRKSASVNANRALEAQRKVGKLTTRNNALTQELTEVNELWGAVPTLEKSKAQRHLKQVAEERALARAEEERQARVKLELERAERRKRDEESRRRNDYSDTTFATGAATAFGVASSYDSSSSCDSSSSSSYDGGSSFDGGGSFGGGCD